MAAPVKFSTKVSGPFFALGSGPIKDAIDALVQDLLTEGEAKVEQQLYAGHGVRTGEYKRSIHDRIVKSAHGVVEDDKSVKGKFLETGRYWSSTGHRFRGYAMFRKATSHLRRLARQFAGKQFARAVKRLT